jgi:ketosteroid isomerase-like protein
MRLGPLSGPLVVLATVLTFAAFAHAQSKGEQEIQAAEKAWADAYQACDVPGMSRILSDDLTLIQHVNGSTMDKDAFLKSMASCSMEKVTNDPARIRVYGDSAVVQGTSTYNIKNMATPISVIFTRVWVKTKGQWQTVNHQSTGLPAPKR